MAICIFCAHYPPGGIRMGVCGLCGRFTWVSVPTLREK